MDISLPTTTSTNYTYTFFLHTEAETPNLEMRADATKQYIPGFRSYTFSEPAAAGSDIINEAIELVKTKCPEYKLIVVGEDPGHMEIYMSDNYKGDLNVSITSLTMEEKLWPSAQ